MGRIEKVYAEYAAGEIDTRESTKFVRANREELLQQLEDDGEDEDELAEQLEEARDHCYS